MMTDDTRSATTGWVLVLCTVCHEQHAVEIEAIEETLDTAEPEWSLRRANCPNCHANLYLQASVRESIAESLSDVDGYFFFASLTDARRSLRTRRQDILDVFDVDDLDEDWLD